MVRRRLDPDRATGQRRFTDGAFCYPGYQSADLAYAITGHSAQGATVYTGIALVTGMEDRQWLYPAMTRGTDTNLAFVFTTPPRSAGPQPAARAAPELDRYDRTRHEHDGYPPGLPGTAGPSSPDLREPVAVLADVLGRDGAELSATQTRRRTLANADHLGILHAIWTAETTGARNDRYRDLVLAALPPGHRRDLSPQGPVAVPHPARRRVGRPGPRRSYPRRHRLPRPGRSPGHRRRPGRPDPLTCRPAAAPAARPLGQPHPPAAGSRTSGLPWMRSCGLLCLRSAHRRRSSSSLPSRTSNSRRAVNYSHHHHRCRRG